MDPPVNIIRHRKARAPRREAPVISDHGAGQYHYNQTCCGQPMANSGEYREARPPSSCGPPRVLVLAHTAGALDGESLPPGLRPAALVVLAERLRPDAAGTIAY